MKKKYKLFNDLKDPEDWIKRDLYSSKYTLGLSRFLNQMLSKQEYEETKDDERKQFEITLEYLSKLLRNGELKMKTFEHEEDLSKKKENHIEYILKSVKEWEQEEMEEGIEYVKERWNSFDDSKDREHFEDWGVMFTLPENEWMY